MPDFDLRKELKDAPGRIKLPQELTAEKAPRFESALTGGKLGLAGGAAAGLIRSLIAPEGQRNYLKNTLAGALLGGGAGALSGYIAGGDPFQRGSPAAKSFETGKEQLMERLLDPRTRPDEALRGAISTGLADYVSGRHEFGPEQQKALIQQFAKGYVPTTSGWKKRVQLVGRAIQQLREDPMGAAQALSQLKKVAPDPEMQQFASEALARIRSGRAATPEGVNALSTIAKQMEGISGKYSDATSVIEALNTMKEMYGKGELNEQELAKNLGLISGRFGAQGPEAEALRRLVQNAMAKPLAAKPRVPYKSLAASTPRVSKLIRRAMSR